MKKIFILFFIIFTSTMLANILEFTGEYSKNLSNPFKKLLITNKDSVYVFSEEKNINLPVVSSTLKTNKSVNISNYIIKNKTIENIVRNSFSDYYNVKVDKSDKFTEINILSGQINLTYTNANEEVINYLNNLFKINVELYVEIVEHSNDKSIQKLKKISLDKTFENVKQEYKLNNHLMNELNKTIKKIIEVELFYLARGEKFD